MQLKECPFCGSEAMVQEDNTDGRWYQVVCKNSQCICNEYNLWWDVVEEAVLEWNWRV